MITVQYFNHATMTPGGAEYTASVDTVSKITTVSFLKSQQQDRNFHRWSILIEADGIYVLVKEVYNGNFKWWAEALIEGASEEELLAVFPRFYTDVAFIRP